MNLLNIIKLQLNVTFNISAFKWYAKHDKKKVLGALALAVVLLVSLAPSYYYFYIILVKDVFQGGYSLGQPEFVFTLAAVAVSLMVLIFGIAFVMSTFYFSQDLSFLIALPLSPSEVIGGKFATVLIQEYLTVIPLMLPVIIIYGTGVRAGLYFWLAALIVMLMLPVIPLTIVSGAVMFLMRVTNLGKRKDFLRIVGMSLMIVILLAFNYFVTKLAPMSQAELMNLIFAREGLAQLVSRYYPPALILTRALTAGGAAAILNLSLFIVLNLAGLFVTLFLAERLFYRGLIGGEEISARKSISNEQLARRLAYSSHPALAIAQREIKILLRTPIYMFNSVGVVLIMPLAMVVPLLGGEAVEPILNLLQTVQSRVLINLGGAAIIGFVAAFAPAASSSFSREGKQFWISQVIPVAPQVQINGKIIYSILLALLAVPLVFLLSAFVTHWSAVELLLVIIIGLCISLPSITIGLLIDLIRPYLNWDNPQRAIKQNVNVVFGMVGTMATYFLLFQVAKFLFMNQYSDFMIYGGVILSSLILGAIPYFIMQKIADRRYREIISP
ncbi:MAG: hypothetical protein GX893_06180 [Firmicutes bacterium]|nr:hypothetical protein [Bacillota bacterium]